ncbi:MAG: hypothetical protein RLZZ341_1516, partial [Pseudomonadota bacterium]
MRPILRPLRLIAVLRQATTATLTLLLASTAAAALPAYDPPVPLLRGGFAGTAPWDINNVGTIVGESDGVGFVYAGGVFTSVLHPLGSSATQL